MIQVLGLVKPNPNSSTHTPTYMRQCYAYLTIDCTCMYINMILKSMMMLNAN